MLHLNFNYDPPSVTAHSDGKCLSIHSNQITTKKVIHITHCTVCSALKTFLKKEDHLVARNEHAELWVIVDFNDPSLEDEFAKLLITILSTYITDFIGIQRKDHCHSQRNNEHHISAVAAILTAICRHINGVVTIPVMTIAVLLISLVLLLHLQAIPSPTTIHDYYELVATLGIIVGGTWGISTWLHQERLRKSHDIPGIEVEIKCIPTAMKNKNILLAVDVVVTNTSNIPILPIIDQVALAIQQLEDPRTDKFVSKSGSISMPEIRLVAPHLKELTLEPHTRTVFSEYFVTEAHRLYLVSFHMPSSFKTSDGTNWVWRKKQIYYVNDSAAESS